MIGKPEWFTYRIAGWGIRPKTKEGWTYTGIFLALILAITYLPIPENIKTYLIGTIVALLVIDSLHIMMQLPKVHDERQNYHQLLIERNVSFMAVISIIISMFILSLKYGFNNNYRYINCTLGRRLGCSNLDCASI